MSTRKDPLIENPSPDRLFFATGSLLDKDDFLAEQTYHRRRLAQALACLHGSGTLTGLKTLVFPENGDPNKQILKVTPGLAIDRLGRLIEVPYEVCLRLQRWYENQSKSDLEIVFNNNNKKLIADVFVSFVACERGKTPAFASGPFDALDAVMPSRIRDGFKFDLILRKEKPLPLPENIAQRTFPDVDDGANQQAVHQAILDSWENKIGEEISEKDKLPKLREHVLGQDYSSVFLARLQLPAQAGSPPVRTPGKVIVNNLIRAFVYPTGVLARLVSI